MKYAIAINPDTRIDFYAMLEKGGVAVNKIGEENFGVLGILFSGIPIYEDERVPSGEYWIGPEQKVLEKIRKVGTHPANK